MPTIHLMTIIEAPIDRVFDLARSIEAHTVSTASTGEKAVAGRTSGLIGPEETVTWEAKHLGVRQRLTVRVTAYDRPQILTDEMTRGAFRSLCHTHRFREDEGRTVMRTSSGSGRRLVCWAGSRSGSSSRGTCGVFLWHATGRSRRSPRAMSGEGTFR